MARVDLAGRVVIVTGAGRGLGRVHCLELARRGAAVVVNDVASEHALAVVEEIESLGGSAVACEASVATAEGAREITDAAIARFGAIDAVVNNAGFMRNGYLEDLTPGDLDAVLAVHVRGSFLVTRAAWPMLRAAGAGRVVMTSSAGGLFAMQGESNYAAAKAGIYGLAKALAFEGREHGIGVNAVLPMATTRIEAQAPVPDYERHYPPGLQAALAPRRLAEAVAPLIAYLVSTDCTVSGEAFSAGFGRYARVFVGEARGWVAADAATVSAEDVADHLEEIRDLEGFAIPDDIYDEVRFIAASLGLG